MANHLQELIDAQLTNLEPHCSEFQTQIQELKTRRNTYAPISKLPDDVLLEIFALIQTLHPPLNHRWYRETICVCRRWRHIAIEAPTLWTRPPLTHHRFAMLMLERSRLADLTVSVYNCSNYETIEQVLYYIGRIEKLEITMNIANMEVVCELLASTRQQASRLRSFHLCSNDDFHFRWDGRPMLELSAFCRFQQLRELYLDKIIFDWNILPLPNLVSFTVTCLYVAQPTLISLQQLLDTLRHMPCLENLQLPISRFLFSFPISMAVTHSMIQVALPRLRRLDVRSSDFDYIQHFLYCIKAPQLQRLVVAPGRTFIDIKKYPDIVQAVASSVTCGDFGTFDRLGLCGRHYFYLNMTREQDSNDDQDTDDDTPYLAFETEDSVSKDCFSQIFVDMLLLCRANIANVVELKISDSAITATELYRLSTALCSVRTIGIESRTHCHLATLIEVLATLPPYSPAQSTTEIPFPALKSVTFSCFSFEDDPAMLEALCNTLMLRCEYGFEIQELDFFKCWILPERLALLGEIVVDVTKTE